MPWSPQVVSEQWLWPFPAVLSKCQMTPDNIEHFLVWLMTSLFFFYTGFISAKLLERVTGTAEVTWVCTFLYKYENIQEQIQHLQSSRDLLVLTYLRMMPPTLLSSDQSVRSSSRSLWWTNHHTHTHTHTTGQQILIIVIWSNWVLMRTHYLYSGVNLVDVWDAAKYCLHFFLGQDGSAHLPLFFQWKLEKLWIKTDMRKAHKHTSTNMFYKKRNINEQYLKSLKILGTSNTICSFWMVHIHI